MTPNNSPIVFISNTKLDETYKPILRGADIHKYAYSFSENYVLFDKEKLWSNTNEDIFETIYFAALTASKDLAKQHGSYASFEGSPASQGLLQYDLW